MIAPLAKMISQSSPSQKLELKQLNSGNLDEIPERSDNSQFNKSSNSCDAPIKLPLPYFSNRSGKNDAVLPAEEAKEEVLFDEQ